MVSSEETLHRQVCDYLRTQYPGVYFRTDFAAGIKMTLGQATKHKRLQSNRAWPDLFIAEPRGDRHGLFIELKRDGTRVWLKNGSLTSDQHIQEQEAVLSDLTSKGYVAQFAVGFESAKAIIDGYLKPRRTTATADDEALF